MDVASAITKSVQSDYGAKQQNSPTPTPSMEMNIASTENIVTALTEAVRRLSAIGNRLTGNNSPDAPPDKPYQPSGAVDGQRYLLGLAGIQTGLLHDQISRIESVL